MNKKIVVAVDGTAGSGKTHTFKMVANEVGYEFIDTGLMYRAFTLLCIENNIDFTVQQEIIDLIPLFDYKVINQIPHLNNKDVEIRIQETDIIKFINYVSSTPKIRDFMVKCQREMVRGGGYIEIGRDITSVVLPDADLKIYLDSSIETRAQRRHKQNILNNINDQSINEIENDIRSRDQHDKIKILKLVDDAWYIDNSNLSVEEVVDMVVKRIKELENK